MSGLCAALEEASWSAGGGVDTGSGDARKDGEMIRALALESRRVAVGLASAARTVCDVASAPDADMVYWLELDGGEPARLTFRAAPINPGMLLREKLLDRLRSAVFTSATLTVNGSFDYMKSRLGLSEAPDGAVLCESIGSPFDYSRQAVVCVPTWMPSPKADERGFCGAVERAVLRLAEVTRGRMLVLFTSHRMLRAVYRNTKAAMEATGICLLAQGMDGSRTRLIEELRDNPDTVVFGSQSFWEGIDVAGPALSCVTIVKLPFARPDDPLVQARMERLAADGVNPFTGFLVPDAVLRFKQGFGRLVRSKTDRGAVVVFDKRVLPGYSPYGSKFLESLPGPSVVSGEEEELLETLREWLPAAGCRG
jgi:ATP-dependent DNA helicase DinG